MIYAYLMTTDVTGEMLEGRKESEDYRRAIGFLNCGIMPTDKMLRAAGIDKETARYMRYKALRRMYDGSK